MTSLKRHLKLYLDTSVPNFIFAEDAKDKQTATKLLFSKDTQKHYTFFISPVVIREIEKAQTAKQKQLLKVIESLPIIEYTEEAETLAQAYLSAKILPANSDEDARHVAVATIHNMDAVVSWNFKHLVNLRRIKLVHLINEQMGYKHIEIISPYEVI
jgi:predicted nucleic acid-binding protein